MLWLDGLFCLFLKPSRLLSLDSPLPRWNILVMLDITYIRDSRVNQPAAVLPEHYYPKADKYSTVIEATIYGM